MTVRPARPEEAAEVTELWRRADSVPSVTDRPEIVRALIERGDEQLLVAEEAGRIIGTLIAAFDGWRGNVYRLAVLPETRRRGVARDLVREGERRLVAKGARRIHAGVRGDHDHATGFWKAAGYTYVAEMRRYTRQPQS